MPPAPGRRRRKAQIRRRRRLSLATVFDDRASAGCCEVENPTILPKSPVRLKEVIRFDLEWKALEYDLLEMYRAYLTIAIRQWNAVDEGPSRHEMREIRRRICERKNELLAG